MQQRRTIIKLMLKTTFVQYIWWDNIKKYWWAIYWHHCIKVCCLWQYFSSKKWIFWAKGSQIDTLGATINHVSFKGKWGILQKIKKYYILFSKKWIFWAKASQIDALGASIYHLSFKGKWGIWQKITKFYMGEGRV